MHNSDVAVAPAGVQDELLDLTPVALHELLSNRDTAATQGLDVVMRRVFDPRDRDKLTVSAFGSAL